MSASPQLIRTAIQRSTTLRTAVSSAPAQWSIQTTRGAIAVRPSLPFATRQLRPGQVGAYRLRDSGLRLTVRHRTRDIAILTEIFGGTGGVMGYAPPRAVEAALDRSGTPRIMDLGANIGLFSLYVLGRWPTAQITAFEPDPDNAALLERTVAANGLARQWHVCRSACANRAGTVQFAAGRFSEARIADPGDVGTVEVPLVDLFAEVHELDLLKIDIEGGEWPILSDPRLPQLQARAIVLEWHSRGCPWTDPGGAARKLLHDAGYTGLVDVGEPKGKADGVLWAWRPADG